MADSNSTRPAVDSRRARPHLTNSSAWKRHELPATNACGVVPTSEKDRSGQLDAARHAVDEAFFELLEALSQRNLIEPLLQAEEGGPPDGVAAGDLEVGKLPPGAGALDYATAWTFDLATEIRLLAARMF